MKKAVKILGLTFLLVCILIVAIRISIVSYSSNKIVDFALIQAKPVVIVPGAGLTRQGTPSTALRDRLDEAIRLYKTGKVQSLLFSGDNREIYYNEPGAMREYALAQGIPDVDIVVDPAGHRTYDTCLRAKVVYGVNDAILVTQKYHLSRAIFLCDKLGVNVEGVAVEESDYIPQRYAFWQFREVFATVAAVWDIYIEMPDVVLDGADPIDLEE